MYVAALKITPMIPQIKISLFSPNNETCRANMQENFYEVLRNTFIIIGKYHADGDDELQASLSAPRTPSLRIKADSRLLASTADDGNSCSTTIYSITFNG